MIKKLLFVSILSLLILGSCFPVASARQGETAIEKVQLNSTSFNPVLGEVAILEYTLNRSAQVSVFIYTSDFDLVKVLVDKKSQKVGQHRIPWDGSDLQGQKVPDEAYFFCIEANFADGTREVYDPTTFSGGAEFEIADIQYDATNGAFQFKLLKPARILIRVGLKDGPLMATPADWVVRDRGHNLVYWSSYDGDQVLKVNRLGPVSFVATGFYLPQTSIITYGNTKSDYFTYQKKLQTTKKPLREEVFREIKLAPNYYYPRREDRSPDFQIEFPQLTGKTPKVKGELLARISVLDEFKKILLKNGFEIALFIDGRFVFEEEEGYTPFNLVWNSAGIEPGEHYLTFVLSSYLGQVSSKTVKIEIEE